MEPLSAIDPQKLRELRGLVFDVDDTVTRQGRLEPGAFSAMWRLHDAGLHLVAVTGRPLGWTDLLARLWPVAAAVGENGAGWAWRTAGGDALQLGYAATAAERAGHAHLLDKIRARVAQEMPHVRVSADDDARRCDLAFDVGEYVQLSSQDIARLLAIFKAEGALSSVSSVHAHAAPAAWDKASGVRAALRQVLHVDLDTERERWLFVGDSGNDAAAFAYFPLSVGVANIREHLDRLPAPPPYVTAADRGRGFEELADLILRVRPS